ncbi:MAG: NAD-glutamate dehydrogenase [Mariprofundaceae bacterium]|nr:NAD-glutamate dehydrogenase [Mariprofundaceae bacterium]
MRPLRSQLIQLLKNTTQEEPWSPRLFAILVQQGAALLSQEDVVCFNHRRVSNHQYHRHVIAIRCPDQAFYLDAIRRYLSCHEIRPLSLQTMVMSMDCHENSCALEIQNPTQHVENNLMLITIHLSVSVVEDIHRFLNDFQAILQAVHVSVQDFDQMKTLVDVVAQKLEKETAQDAELLRWMSEDQYVFIGISSHWKSLGLLNHRTALNHIAPGLLEEVEGLAESEELGLSWLHLTCAQTHLYSLWGYEVVRATWREDGLLHQLILLGRFTRSARHVNAHNLPRLSDIWQKIHMHSSFRLSAFYRREVRILFDRLPKPFLLTVNVRELLTSLEKIVRMTDAAKLHLSCFRPAFGGDIWFLLLALETGRYGPNVLKSMLVCIQGFGVTVHAHHHDDSVESRQILLMSCSGEMPEVSLLHAAVQNCVYFWKDRVRDLMMKESRNLDIPQSFEQLNRMPLVYQHYFEPEQFLGDMQSCEKLVQDRRTQVQVLHQKWLECHFFSLRPLLLGELVVCVQNLGLQAQQEAVVDFEYQGNQIYLSSIRVLTDKTCTVGAEDLLRVKKALQCVINQDEDNDLLNALVVSARMSIDEVAALICLRNHLIQLVESAAPLGLTHIMLAYPRASAALFQVFKMTHQAHKPSLLEAVSRFEDELMHIGQLSEDRWFRALLELAQASVRTNVFIRQCGEPIAIKVNTQQLSFAPQPKPYREIFVHGVHLEGVHLRGGAVARGGIRYSDRAADFRTEVLELMATQVLKNGVIVPTGAKGGFIVRGHPDAAFVKEQYCLFIRTLLSLTDLSVDQVSNTTQMYIPPEDANDAYLVVAADKGTASFSDAANAESLRKNFWLGDAFASGGSHGYDHKAYGITARGAWVCAQHLCARLQILPSEPLGVVGIGDMGGDVFGNGLLCQSPLRLFAAFNHKHIFLDPNPDIQGSRQERQRLFDAVVGWDQYDTACISQGGGVFLRSAKAIPLSLEVQQSLAIDDAEVMTGEALIQAILCAKVDVLFNGGIGTYVKASDQSHESVHDPVNNSVRVNGSDLRCRLVCEGGNLGFSQQARLEYSQHGGLMSSDAIDNSAGVDMSDHEVNIKILIDQDPLEEAQRDLVLHQVGEDVVQLCLDDNQAQSKLLSLAELDVKINLSSVQQLRATLLKEKRLDMRVDACIAQDDKMKLRPQLAVLMGHEKNRLYHDLCLSHFDEKHCFYPALLHSYFPSYLQENYASNIVKHALATQIVATQAVNKVLNECGLCSVHELQRFTSCRVDEAVWALLLAHQLLDMAVLQTRIWQEVRNLDVALLLQRQCQQWLLTFARHLLSCSLSQKLCASTIQKQRDFLRAYRYSRSMVDVNNKCSSLLMNLLGEASLSGLETETVKHFQCISQLIQSAVPLSLSLQKGETLPAWLRINHACLKVLPFETLEKALFSKDWSDTDAHTLRCNWLQRLNVLRRKAVQALQAVESDDFMIVAQERWSQHPYWQQVAAIDDEPMPQMHLILMLGYFEQLIQES